MEDAFEFEIWQDDMPVASASASTREAAFKEALHYLSVYLQDGPVKLVEVARTTIVDY
jgi:hypothetical protein